MSGEKISVIVPCYNVGDMVSECIECIVNQTIGLEHLEIILVDDASTDNPSTMVQHLQVQIDVYLRMRKLDLDDEHLEECAREYMNGLILI